ncbi:MAG: Asparagine synthetase (glutamine-hydrolyzing) 1 [Lentisphaerae bacterium ADurb.BinA184]|nr:MAG: Asparagine synthetase (glutamine-hydrolyzing) 1 [Lentisphaerae bacterium ADurb.BinA184]
MCGIAGIHDPEQAPGPDLLARLSAALACRGPDDEGTLARGPLGLVHRRLSIIDVEGGHQPILNEDASLALVCNGEIYNYRELRERLAARGHRFRTQGDSEVILHLYEERGAACLHDLGGMFAFAVAHLDSGELFLARDRFGEKPLFYAWSGPRFAFASGPAALAVLPWVETALDCRALHHYLEFNCIPHPLSVHCGIRKLPPGHVGVWHPEGCLGIERWWRPQPPAPFAGPYSEAVAETRRRLEESVRRQLVADVPVGTFLSGGMDSTIVSALAARAVAPARLHTFSIGFPEHAYDERGFAELAARGIGSQHHFLEVRPDSLDDLATVVAAFEEPFADASMLPTARLARFARQHVKVVLGGDGADELFGGYYRHRVIRLFEAVDWLPPPLRRALAAVGRRLPAGRDERTAVARLRRLLDIADHDGLARYLRLISRFPSAARRALYGPAMLEGAGDADGLEILAPHAPSGRRPVDTVMLLDLETYLPDDILVKLDRASMACALEVRAPFLDPEVAGLALSLPYGFKQRGRRRKRILQDAFRDLVPREILFRPKMGFGLPVAAWLRGGWLAPARDALLGGVLPPDLFRRDGLERLLDDHAAARADHSYPLFALLVLSLWLRERRPPTRS